MARISDLNRFPVDSIPSFDDFVIGSDSENNKITKNYRLGGIFNTFTAALELSTIEFTFSDSVSDGYFISNNLPDSSIQATQASDIALLTFSVNNAAGTDVSAFFDVIASQPTSFTLKLHKSSDVGEVFYFNITNVTNNGNGSYTFAVSNFVGANEMVIGTTYGLFFDISGVPSVYTEVDPVFSASASAGITSTNITNWNTAFGWGDHAAANYLESADINTFAELNTIVADATLAKHGDNLSDFVNDAGFITSAGATTVNWGDIEGTLSSQTDLQSALNAKLNLSGGFMTGKLRVTTSAPQLELKGVAAGASNLATVTFQDSSGVNQGHVGINNNRMLLVNAITGTYVDISSAGLQYNNGSTSYNIVHEGMAPNFTTNSVTANNFILSSDRRLKSDIEDIQPRGSVQWRQFKMNGETRYGVVADEVEELYPEFVYEGYDGYKKVAYIDLLVAENARLRSEIDELKKDVEVIKQMIK